MPPTALTLMWTAVMPLVLATSDAAEAERMAAYGDASNRSAFTCLPPDENDIVSAPVRSVMCTMVLL